MIRRPIEFRKVADLHEPQVLDPIGGVDAACRGVGIRARRVRGAVRPEMRHHFGRGQLQEALRHRGLTRGPTEVANASCTDGLGVTGSLR